MAITITGGTQRQSFGMQSVEQMTQSTATAAQTLSAVDYISVLGAGTATGTLSINQYVLPEGPDGLEKIVYLAATGEATLQMTQATGIHAQFSTSSDAVFRVGAATGAYVLNAKADYVRAVFLDGGWTVLGTNATLATAT